MPTPIALSDEQLLAISAAARPLTPDARAAFFEEVAQEISRHPVLGDGLLYRTIMQVQRRHYDPPIESRGRPAAKGPAPRARHKP
jgi:hypothetical protein